MAEGRDSDLLHAGWCDQFRALSQHVVRMHARSEVYEGLDAELARTGRPGSGLLVAILRPMYAEAQAIAVRRLVDETRRTNSLVRLVGEMARNSTVLTRERYVSQWDSEYRSSAEADFDLIAGTGADHFPKRRLLEIADELKTAGSVVKNYADQHVAHEGSGDKRSLTFGQLKEAIHKVSELYELVGRILTGSHHASVPVIQDDWREPFRDGLFRGDAAD